MSKGCPRQGNQILHPQQVLDLFTTFTNMPFTLWFSLSMQNNPPRGVDLFVYQSWLLMLFQQFC